MSRQKQPCYHPIWWQTSKASIPKCVICNPPPRRGAFRLGVLSEDGRSVITASDFTQAIIRRNQEGAEKRALALLGDWAEDFEIVHTPIGKDGWPKGSFPYRESAQAHGLIGIPFPPKTSEIPPPEICVPKEEAERMRKVKEEAERNRREYEEKVKEDIKKAAAEKRRTQARKRRKRKGVRLKPGVWQDGPNIEIIDPSD